MIVSSSSTAEVSVGAIKVGDAGVRAFSGNSESEDPVPDTASVVGNSSFSVGVGYLSVIGSSGNSESEVPVIDTASVIGNTSS